MFAGRRHTLVNWSLTDCLRADWVVSSHSEWVCFVWAQTFPSFNVLQLLALFFVLIRFALHLCRVCAHDNCMKFGIQRWHGQGSRQEIPFRHRNSQKQDSKEMWMSNSNIFRIGWRIGSMCSTAKHNIRRLKGQNVMLRICLFTLRLWL